MISTAVIFSALELGFIYALVALALMGGGIAATKKKQKTQEKDGE